MARRISTPQNPPATTAPPVRKPAARRSGTTPGGLVLALVILLVTGLLLGHKLIPNGNGFGSLVESFLPWLGVPLGVLGLVAALTRSKPALIATGCAVLAWVGLFGPALVPRGPGGPADLRVLSHNMFAANSDPAGTARALRDAGADVVAVQEVAGASDGALHSALDPAYKHRQNRGTLGVWSRFPLRDVQPVDVGMGWVRALKMVVDTPKGPVTLYVVHLASIRFGADGLASQRRDATLAALTGAIEDDPARRLILAGDLNTASTDRSLGGLTGQLTEAQDKAGSGFGFTWPTGVPMVRLDHILSRGLTATDATVLAGTGSDHRPIEASFRF
ncbi:endonuclease/exonuclease/phosphatase family protein [Longispora sp. NPDC051575]|uniref:endonuclease/exonuclease/phosphatase family protein n=1 Tax=Longispora sp. NPDC051575 TaxID=3154943 RepID=UPI0034490B9D